MSRAVTFEDLSERPADYLRPPVDRAGASLETLTADQRYWREHGYLILERFMPDRLMDAYSAVRSRCNGWNEPFPYLWVPEIRDLCLHRPLLDKLHELIGSELAMNLNLTGWTSTERNWHQDDYLNPPTVNGHYAAVWFALDDIHPDSGPFEYVPGSNRWPVMRRSKVRRLLPLNRRYRGDWPTQTQAVVSGIYQREIEARSAGVKQFIAKRGDVLIWHSCLVHRGSEPRVKGMLRKSIITHYTAIEKGLHFPSLAKHGEGWYFDFGRPGINRLRSWVRQAFGIKHKPA